MKTILIENYTKLGLTGALKYASEYVEENGKAEGLATFYGKDGKPEYTVHPRRNGDNTVIVIQYAN